MNDPQPTGPEIPPTRRDRPPQRYLTTAKACKQYGITPSYLRRLASKGLLTRCKFGVPGRDAMHRDRRLSLWLVWELESLLTVEAGTGQTQRHRRAWRG